MIAVYGNLMVMGIAVALFVATVNLGKKRESQAEADSQVVSSTPMTDPPV
jgi:hypothetical protein